MLALITLAMMIWTCGLSPLIYGINKVLSLIVTPLVQKRDFEKDALEHLMHSSSQKCGWEAVIDRRVIM